MEKQKKSLIYSVKTHSSKLTWIKLRFQHHNLAYKRVKQGSLGPNALTQQRDLSIENNTIRVLAFGFEITDATFKSKIHFFVVLCIKLSVGQTTFPGQKKKINKHYIIWKQNKLTVSSIGNVLADEPVEHVAHFEQNCRKRNLSIRQFINRFSKI